MTKLLVGVFLLWTATASADEIDPNRQAAMRYLEQARKLSADGKHAEACPQYEASYKAAAIETTLDDLASCYRAHATALIAAKQDSTIVCSRIVSDAAVAPSKAASIAVATCHLTRADVLVGVKDFKAGCEASEAAIVAVPSPTNLMFAGGCYRDAGKLGRAWRRLLDAKAKLATEPNPEIDRVVVELLSAVRPGRLIVTVAAGATVTIDGEPLPKQGLSIGGAEPEKDAQGTIGYPLDGGPHVLKVTADGKTPVEKTITIVDGNLERVPVELVDATTTNPITTTPETPAPKSSRKKIGWITIAASGVVGAVGLYFGYDALTKQNDADKLCPERTCGDQNAIDLNDKAGRSANISNVLVGVALAGGIVGTILVVTAPKETKLAVSASPSGGGVTLSRRF